MLFSALSSQGKCWGLGVLKMILSLFCKAGLGVVPHPAEKRSHFNWLSSGRCAWPEGISLRAWADEQEVLQCGSCFSKPDQAAPLSED